MLANVSFGASVVAMNAYIPSLAKESPEVIEVHQEMLIVHSESQGDEGRHHSRSLDNSEADPGSPEAPLIPRQATASSPRDSDAALASSSPSSLKTKYDTTLSRAISRISSIGIAMGYTAGICLLIVTLVPVTKLGGSTFALRLAIGLSGVWWAVFSIPAGIWLPGAGETEVKWLHRAEEGETDGDGWGDAGTSRLQREEREWRLWAEIRAAWIRLGDMLRWTEILKLMNTFKYLAAWFLLSDGRS